MVGVGAGLCCCQIKKGDQNTHTGGASNKKKKPRTGATRSSGKIWQEEPPWHAKKNQFVGVWVAALSVSPQKIYLEK